MADEKRKPAALPARAVPKTEAEIRREAEEAGRVESTLRILRAVKRQGWWWPGED